MLQPCIYFLPCYCLSGRCNVRQSYVQLIVKQLLFCKHCFRLLTAGVTSRCIRQFGPGHSTKPAAARPVHGRPHSWSSSFCHPRYREELANGKKGRADSHVDIRHVFLCWSATMQWCSMMHVRQGVSLAVWTYYLSSSSFEQVLAAVLVICHEPVCCNCCVSAPVAHVDANIVRGSHAMDQLLSCASDCVCNAFIWT